MEYSIDNVDWILFGVKALMGTLGIVAYALWKVRTHLKEFSPKTLWRENRAFWGWAITMVVVVLGIITISPDTSSAIKSMIGLDVESTATSFLLLGWSLSALSNEVNKKPLNKKNNE